jgi:hypothetical protein
VIQSITNQPVIHRLLALFSAVVLVACSPGEQPAPTPASPVKPDAVSPVAMTTAGKVEGSVSEGIFTFKGIRYGADTATTRFAAPATPQPWEDVKAANMFGASCPHPQGDRRAR